MLPKNTPISEGKHRIKLDPKLIGEVFSGDLVPTNITFRPESSESKPTDLVNGKNDSNIITIDPRFEDFFESVKNEEEADACLVCDVHTDVHRDGHSDAGHRDSHSDMPGDSHTNGHTDGHNDAGHRDSHTDHIKD